MRLHSQLHFNIFFKRTIEKINFFSSFMNVEDKSVQLL